MNGSNFFQVGYYVQYLGNSSVPAGPLHAPGKARIDDFETFFNTQRIYLFLFDIEQHIWCDYWDIMPIQTDEKHFLHCGFEAVMVHEAKKYSNELIVVSSCAIVFDHLTIFSGYCVADFFAQPIQIDKYVQKGDFDTHLFYLDYPSVNTINELFTILKSQHKKFPWETIART